MMHSRYPAPDADRIFSDEERFRRWRIVTDAMATQLFEKEPNGSQLQHELVGIEPPDPIAVKTAEQWIGHDVVAFLRQYTLDMSPDLKRYIHYGLTSSDVVDNALFDALAEHADCMSRVLRVYFDNPPYVPDNACAGRTHGQLAEVTSWRHRINVWENQLRDIHGEMHRLSKELRVSKTPGPTGIPHLRPKTSYIGRRLVESTQVIPRDLLLRWASVYLRLATHCENLALLIRLGSRADVAEVREGAVHDRVGSSAMPHKKNPIASERVCGLARVVRGHFLAIAESVALWEDRDLTNSSVERIAVPQLAQLTEHMFRTMAGVMANLEYDINQIEFNIQPECFANLYQSTLQAALATGPYEAGQFFRETVRGVNPVSWRGKLQMALIEEIGEYAADVWANTVDIHMQTMLGGHQ